MPPDGKQAYRPKHVKASKVVDLSTWSRPKILSFRRFCRAQSCSTWLICTPLIASPKQSLVMPGLCCARLSGRLVPLKVSCRKDFEGWSGSWWVCSDQNFRAVSWSAGSTCTASRVRHGHGPKLFKEFSGVWGKSCMYWMGVLLIVESMVQF